MMEYKPDIGEEIKTTEENKSFVKTHFHIFSHPLACPFPAPLPLLRRVTPRPCFPFVVRKQTHPHSSSSLSKWSKLLPSEVEVEAGRNHQRKICKKKNQKQTKITQIQQICPKICTILSILKKLTQKGNLKAEIKAETL